MHNNKKKIMDSDPPGTSQKTLHKPLTAIKTFAFFDLETTGLPDLEFFKTKITELCIIACSVDHFIDPDIKIPRLLHKLTLCFNPYKRIDIKSTEVTGLTNELLEHENKFDKNAMNIVESFLYQLQQPVCIIAHNGNNIDFPLLKKQYDKLEGTFPFATRCCDSLPVFHKMDKELEQKMILLNRSYSLQKWSHVNGNSNNKSLINVDEIKVNPSAKEENEVDEEFHKIIKDELERDEQENEKSHDDDDVKSRQKMNETTPKVLTKSQNLQPHAHHSTRSHSTSFKRQFFASTSVSTTQNRTRKSFSLREVYKRIYNSYPDHSHDAESDVYTLLKCAIHYKEDFVKIVNETCIDFNDVKKF